MRRLPLPQIFFIVEMKDYITTSTLTTYYKLRNDRQSDGIHGNPRKIGFPRSPSDIFCIHNISSTKSIANQSLLITAILFCHWQREVAVRDKTNGCIGDQFPTGSAGYCVVTKGASPQKAREALRDKTKSCCTGLTCQHNNTKS